MDHPIPLCPKGGSGAGIKLGEVVIILDLHRQGPTVSAIARELGVDRKTVRRCIARGLEPPVYGPRKPRQRLIDPFVPYLRERVMAGDFSFQPSLDRNRILALAQLDFVDRHEVIHFLGPPGTGKSHLATALGVEAVKTGPQCLLPQSRRHH